MRTRLSLVICTSLLTAVTSTSMAGYVLPQLGGGQVGQGSAPMKHADITFDGVNLGVQVDFTVSIPLLRSLVPPDQFDPSMPWYVLENKAHNFQYGWNPSGFWAPPVGTGIWIEQVSASPELEVYFVDGLPASIPYDPIFGTDGSPTIWKWSGAMTHNAYAVLNPTKPSYEATYRVFIGNETTGAEVSGYGSALVTFEFSATPLLTADFNDDGFVDEFDLIIWQENYGMANGAAHEDGDTDQDGDVDGRDFLAWQRQFSPAAQVSAVQVPEPTSLVLALYCFLVRSPSARRCFLA